MPRRNHGKTRQIKVSRQVIEAARLVAERYPDEFAAFEATTLLSKRRVTRREWNRLMKLA